MFKELTAGITVETLSPVFGFKPTSLAQSLFPAMFPVVTEVPSVTLAIDAEPFEMGAASHWCDYCSLETTPVPLSTAAHGWNLFPCHLYECGCCFETGETLCENCEKVQDCCSCYFCEWGEHMVSDVCGNCDYCSNHCDCSDEDEDDCDCYSCRGSHSYGAAPWVQRGDRMPNGTTENVASLIRDQSKLMGLDPVQAMADFYLCDYVATVCEQVTRNDGRAVRRIAQTCSMGHRYFVTYGETDEVAYWTDHCVTCGVSLANANVPDIGGLERSSTYSVAMLQRSAVTLQRSIVQRADWLFQEYTFAAIGGEVRHHGSVAGSVPGGRESCWDYWHAMGETIGRERLTQDCVDIFGDGSWDSGYGGDAWRAIAKTLLMRLDGRLDARTFVDRVFSLQHNGGSLLDKASWAKLTPNGWGVSYCENIGNAHASETIGFDVLLENASKEVRAMLHTLAMEHGSLIPGFRKARDWNNDYSNLTDALSTYYASEEN